MGSCLSDFLAILETHTNFHEAVEYINARYGEDSAVMIEDDDVVLSDQHHAEEPVASQRSLLKTVLIIAGISVYFIVLSALFG